MDIIDTLYKPNKNGFNYGRNRIGDLQLINNILVLQTSKSKKIIIIALKFRAIYNIYILFVVLV